MKFDNPIPILEIAQWVGAEIIGEGISHATGINEIHKVVPGDITFVDVEKYFEKSLNSAASIVILNKRIESPRGKILLFCEEPFLAYEKIINKTRPRSRWDEGTRQEQSVDPTTFLEPNVRIGNHVTIGKDCLIESGVIIRDYVTIGDRVWIQSGSIIGSDAFYLKKWGDRYESWTTAGRVRIEDDVQIGAACTINRGVSGDTIIGSGTKMDCQVQIGHGAVIGKNCLIAAQVGVAGKTIIGDSCTLYGQVGIAQNLVIGNRVTILAKSGVGINIPDDKVYFGIPAIEAREKKKQLVILKQLADGWDTLKKVLRRED